MIINVRTKNGYIEGYRTYPIKFEEEYVEIEEIPADILCGEYRCKNHILYKNDSPLLSSCEKKKSAYDKEDLVKAFEAYKNDVFYGEIEENKEMHTQILEWHKTLMNSKEEALSNPPLEILKRLEGRK